ncbi:MFS transporter [Mycobacterium noviomagense]|uniref:MFS transporter n=1 Tax=Mycobacterium noviomagense TaxID=459858 RepID=A0ABX3TAI3_9MYCO|nr:MFS transporter [Mycobacterium noviomagense]
MRAGGAGRATAAKPQKRPHVTKPWHALWAMIVGFFMILVDSTIVAVANPSIMAKLGTGYDTVIWVTSAYLLAYAVPLLVAGRLGDRFGPKNLYMIGLAVFTAASLWCGLSGSIGMLIAARVVQGIGAALLTPQTLSMITRIFPPERRGMAMSLWGATAGVATLVGPLAGGVLVDGLGWEWIFFVNVPIGIIGMALAVWLIPVLPTNDHRFDLAGVGLSGAGMFLVVFGLQQGQAGGWAPWIWAVIVAGIGFMVMFVYWQAINTGEPLIPLHIFSDRNFSLANLAVAVIGFAATAMILPLMFYAQAVCGLSPTRSALLTAPMAIVSGLLAPVVGKIVDNYHPRPVVGFGFSVLAIGLTWLSIETTPTTPIWRLVLPFAAIGFGMAFVWQPLAATATRNLPPDVAGAGAGVFNATRLVGAVLGSAGIAAFMSTRITAEMPPMPDGASPPGPQAAALQLPAFLREPFAAAMSQSMLLPAFIALFGVGAALFMVGFGLEGGGQTGRARDGLPAGVGDRTERVPVMADDDVVGDDYDDDDYVEYTIAREPALWQEPAGYDEDDTAPLKPRVERPRPTPRTVRHPDPTARVEPIGFAHNGSHVDDRPLFRPFVESAASVTDPRSADAFVDEINDTYGAVGYGPPAEVGSRNRQYHGSDESTRQELADDPFPPSENRRSDSGRAHSQSDDDDVLWSERFWRGSSTRHQGAGDEPPRNRHYRADFDDPPSYGRHSSHEPD